MYPYINEKPLALIIIPAPTYCLDFKLFSVMFEKHKIATTDMFSYTNQTVSITRMDKVVVFIRDEVLGSIICTKETSSGVGPRVLGYVAVIMNYSKFFKNHLSF